MKSQIHLPCVEDRIPGERGLTSKKFKSHYLIWKQRRGEFLLGQKKLSRNHLSGREYTRESTEIGIKIFIGGLFITRKSLGHPRE
jgi:hypothetical protein